MEKDRRGPDKFDYVKFFIDFSHLNFQRFYISNENAKWSLRNLIFVFFTSNFSKLISQPGKLIPKFGNNFHFSHSCRPEQGERRPGHSRKLETQITIFFLKRDIKLGHAPSCRKEFINTGSGKGFWKIWRTTLSFSHIYISFLVSEVRHLNFDQF